MLAAAVGFAAAAAGTPNGAALIPSGSLAGGAIGAGAGGAGSIAEGSLAGGTKLMDWHFGHLAFLPTCCSGTRKVFEQPLHENSTGIGRPFGW